MSNQWDFVVETLEDSDCDDLDIDMIFESKDTLGYKNSFKSPLVFTKYFNLMVIRMSLIYTNRKIVKWGYFFQIFIFSTL